MIATEPVLHDPQVDATLVALRQQFPILQQQVHGHPLVYLDNAATSQKPLRVLAAMQQYYQQDNSNVHRGVHTLSMRATEAYENARETLRQFLNARSAQEVIFVRSGTEAINCVAASLGQCHIRPQDEILLTQMEHHANIVPWQLACERVGAKLTVIPIHTQGELDIDRYEKLLQGRVALVALTHVSNVLGTVNPIKKMVAMAHAQGIPVLVDGAQAGPHATIDVQDLDCDFYTLSGHKMYGPTGTGVLYGRTQWLQKMPPYQGGGDMIKEVTFARSTYAEHPYKFEAGTPNIAGAIGFAEAVRFIQETGLSWIHQHERRLIEYATRQFQEMPEIQVFGAAADKAAILSFNYDGIHAHDVGTVLDHHGIAVRTGHHCAMPLMQYYGVPAMVRVSFALFNTLEEVDKLCAGLRHVRKVLG